MSSDSEQNRTAGPRHSIIVRAWALLRYHTRFCCPRHAFRLLPLALSYKCAVCRWELFYFLKEGFAREPQDNAAAATDDYSRVTEDTRWLQIYHAALITAKPSLEEEYTFEQLCAEWKLVLGCALIAQLEKSAKSHSPAERIMANEAHGISRANQQHSDATTAALVPSPYNE